MHQDLLACWQHALTIGKDLLSPGAIGPTHFLDVDLKTVLYGFGVYDPATTRLTERFTLLERDGEVIFELSKATTGCVLLHLSILEDGHPGAVLTCSSSIDGDWTGLTVDGLTLMRCLGFEENYCLKLMEQALDVMDIDGLTLRAKA